MNAEMKSAASHQKLLSFRVLRVDNLLLKEQTKAFIQSDGQSRDTTSTAKQQAQRASEKELP